MTACGAVVMIVPLALHRSQLGAGNPELGWVSWIVFAAGSGVLVGLVFLSVTRLRAARGEAGLALAACMLFGAGIGSASYLSAFVSCGLAAALIVNASPRRRQMQTALAEWERPICAVFLIIAGALLTLPTVWILAAVPVLAALRVGARWASARYARVALGLRDVPSHIGLGTVAQGGTALALGINYFLMYGGRPDTPGGGIAGDAAGAGRPTLGLGIAPAQPPPPPPMRPPRPAGPPPLAPPAPTPRLSANPPAGLPAPMSSL